ncbi:hypothetical protein, partial [Mesorhizobium sp. M1E.F.Ca.ET.063.01.1.1]|uniref:hypothetical protein n=1 Tax=Mesorhizobium sp. M1E.F.Ca.ET.063.01.1.1 TaxID=2496750 RepID=UPI001AECA583
LVAATDGLGEDSLANIAGRSDDPEVHACLQFPLIAIAARQSSAWPPRYEALISATIIDNLKSHLHW